MKEEDTGALSKKDQKVVLETILELLAKLEIEGEINVSFTSDTIEVAIDTVDNGMIIGYHGEVLEALQLISSLAVAKKLNKFIRVLFEVGEYRKNRTEWLENLARETKERVLSGQQEVLLPRLRPWERRVIHLYFQDDKEVVSESVGVGWDRTLIVKPQ